VEFADEEFVELELVVLAEVELVWFAGLVPFVVVFVVVLELMEPLVVELVVPLVVVFVAGAGVGAGVGAGGLLALSFSDDDVWLR
jgi:hypothetical protein